jgi:hypothetical protein
MYYLVCALNYSMVNCIIKHTCTHKDGDNLCEWMSNRTHCMSLLVNYHSFDSRRGSSGGRTRRPPLKLEKILFFGVKSWFFTRNTPTIFAPPSARRNFFQCAPPNLKSWIRHWICAYNIMFKHSVHNLYLMYTYNLDNWCNNMYLLCINLNTLTL